MNMRCDQCRFWGEAASPDILTQDVDAQRAGMRMCGAVDQRCHIEDGVRDQMSARRAGDFDDDDVDQDYVAACARALAARRAFTADGSCYFSALFTGPDFFCALFEPALSANTEPQDEQAPNAAVKTDVQRT